MVDELYAIYKLETVLVLELSWILQEKRAGQLSAVMLFRVAAAIGRLDFVEDFS